jgi:hypothetical protein
VLLVVVVVVELLEGFFVASSPERVATALSSLMLLDLLAVI